MTWLAFIDRLSVYALASLRSHAARRVSTSAFVPSPISVVLFAAAEADRVWPSPLCHCRPKVNEMPRV